MKYIVCSIWDAKVGSYNRPFVVQSIGQAIRSFGDEVKRPSREDNLNPLFDHPEDFTLFQLGFWDDLTGDFANEIVSLIKAVAI